MNSKRVFLANGRSLYTIDEGVGDPIVLLHGYPLSSQMWSDVLPQLAKGNRVIAPDFRGFGRSMDDPIAFLSMKELADDIALLLDALGIVSSSENVSSSEKESPIHLVGLSMGGYVAFEFWARHGSRLRSLTLCDTRAGADTPEAAMNRLRIADHAVAIGSERSTEGMLSKLISAANGRNRPELLDQLTKMMYSTSPSTIAAAQRAMAGRRSFLQELANIEVPTLVVVGAEDAISPPSEMSEIADSIPNSSYVEIPGAGHLTPMEDPVAFVAAVLGFVSKQCR